MQAKKVLVGMSGGVDSSVAAALLVEQGYEVTGVYVEAYNEPGCRTEQDKKDALQVALKLGIKFCVLDYREPYYERVVKYFLDEYKAGRTPNPDIVCNREIKFGLLYDYMVKEGYDYLATGHYARVGISPAREGVVRYELRQGVDLGKDQTYFLWQVAEDKLARVLWPVGNLHKNEVREKARELGLPNANKPDSMGVCMIGELNVSEFLESKLGVKKGNVVWNGSVIGEHRGLWFYTIGTRGGWELKPSRENKKQVDFANLPPLYVKAKRGKENVLEVGEWESCLSKGIVIKKMKGSRNIEDKIWVRIRNLGELVEVESWNINPETVELVTKDKVFAVAEGQSAVFYSQDGTVVGGGIICSSTEDVVYSI